MKTFMSFITNYYWLMIACTLFLGISILGINVDNRREKADEIGEKMDEQMIKEAEEEAQRKKENHN